MAHILPLKKPTIMQIINICMFQIQFITKLKRDSTYAEMSRFVQHMLTHVHTNNCVSDVTSRCHRATLSSLQWHYLNQWSMTPAFSISHSMFFNFSCFKSILSSTCAHTLMGVETQSFILQNQ